MNEPLDVFVQKWLGQRTNPDGVYGYQCVDLILQYLSECYGIGSGVWGNAIDYWTNPTATLMTRFHKVPAQMPAAGDITVLNGLAGNPFGHVGVATGKTDGNSFEMLEQNGSTGNGDGMGGNAIRTRMIDVGRLAGILRYNDPKEHSPAPAPAGGYVINKPVPGYYTSYDARDHNDQKVTVPAGTYAIYNRYLGMLNVTTDPRGPGAWINPSDNS